MTVIKSIANYEKTIEELCSYFKSVHKSNCDSVMIERWFCNWGTEFFAIEDEDKASNYLNYVESELIGKALDMRLESFDFVNAVEMYRSDYEETASYEDIRTFLDRVNIYDMLDKITNDCKAKYFDKTALMEEWDNIRSVKENTVSINKEQSNIVKHDCGNGYKVVMENYTWLDENGTEHHEFLTYIEKDGIAWQDITMVRFTDDSTPSVKVNVWAETSNEDYTHEFNIDVYEEE